MNNQEPLSGKHLVVVGGGLAGCSVAHFAKDFFEKITLIDNVAPDRRNAFVANAGNLHVGYGTTGHAHSAMIKNNSPLLGTIKVSFKNPDVFSLLFAPKIVSTYRALSMLGKLYDKEVAKHSSFIFYFLYKRSIEIIEKILQQEKVPTKKGRMALCRTAEHFTYIQKQLEFARENFSVGGEIISDIKKIRKLFPSAPDEIIGGIYYKEDVSFHPPTFSNVWLKQLGSKVELVDGLVSDVVVRGKEVVEVKVLKKDGVREEVPTHQVVFCTGCTNHPVMNPYTLPGGGVSVDVDLERGAPVGDTHLYTPERLVYMYPYAKDKLRLCTGLYMNKAKLSVSKIDKIHEYVKNSFHEYYGNNIAIKNIIDTYVGARAISPDAMPIAGKLPYLNNGYIVNGLGSYGYPAAALVEAILFPTSGSPTPPPSLKDRVAPARFSPLWTSIARKLTAINF